MTTIALIGGTGQEGRGLAQRFTRAGITVRLGSRDPERGAQVASELGVLGGDYAFALEGADLAMLCVPYTAHRPVLEAIKPLLGGRVVIDITVPLKPPKVRQVFLPEGHEYLQPADYLLL